jgi:phosphatidate cytidylyltransferase
VRQRSISSVGVVIVGILPALMGGAPFAFVLTLLCLIGLHEYNGMTARLGRKTIPTGYGALIAFPLVAGFEGGTQALLGAAAMAAGMPLVWAMFRPNLDGAFVDWALAAAGTLYLGVPLFAAVALRTTGGDIDAEWLADLAAALSFGWSADPRGLAWLLTVIVVTWLSDTGAYLIGRSFGRTQLIARLSPKKTVEGLAGGLACAAATGALAVALFGLDVPWWGGAMLGLVLGGIGVIGDLAESLFKRQAGIKDSGTLIPGHGGMLDRIDALLFTWTAGWFFASLMDRWF